MPNALVVCFSITGTTRAAAESVARGLRRGGFAAEVAELSARPGEAPLQVPAGVDLLAVGSPVHYYRLPAPVSAWVSGLPRLDGVAALPFVLHGTYPGGGGTELRRLLRGRGCREAGYRRLPGTGSYLPYARRGWRFSPGRPDAADLAAAEEWAARAARGLEPPSPPDGRTHWMYRLERALSAAPLVRRVYAPNFSADPAVCDGCGVCVKKCPTGNVAQHERRALPAWGRECLMCLECALRCPADAVRSPADWAAFRPFFAYNVRRGLSDPALGKVPVRVERGRIVEL